MIETDEQRDGDWFLHVEASPQKPVLCEKLSQEAFRNYDLRVKRSRLL